MHRNWGATCASEGLSCPGVGRLVFWTPQLRTTKSGLQILLTFPAEPTHTSYTITHICTHLYTTYAHKLTSHTHACHTHTYCSIEYRQGRGVAAGFQTRLSFPELLQFSFKCTLGLILGKAGRPFWASPSGSRRDMVAFPSIESDLSQHRSQILHLPKLLKLPIACGKRGRAITQAGERDLILAGDPASAGLHMT